jgi:hypothetical protein
VTSAAAIGTADAGAGLTGCDPGRCVQDIQAAFQAKRPLARACYEDGLKQHPGIEGKLTVAFEIDPKGAVVRAELNAQESEITDGGVLACIADIFKKVPFPASPRGRKTLGNYRFEFHPKR